MMMGEAFVCLPGVDCLTYNATHGQMPNRVQCRLSPRTSTDAALNLELRNHAGQEINETPELQEG
jgi:hypothetical protein